eukprot:jgi/Mesvir1/14885/Mv05492-RA.1
MYTTTTLVLRRLAGDRRASTQINRDHGRSAARIPGKPAGVVCTLSDQLGSAASEDNLIARDRAESSTSGGWGFAQFSKILPFKRPTQGASSVDLRDKLEQVLLEAVESPAERDLLVTRACEVAAEYQEAWAARESKLVAEAAALKEKSDKLESERRQLVKKLESMTNTSALRRMLSDAEALSQLAEEGKAAQEIEAQRLTRDLAAVKEQLQKEKGAVLEMKTKLAAVTSLQQVVPGLQKSLLQAATEREALTHALATVLVLFVAQSKELADGFAAKTKDLAEKYAKQSKELAEAKKQLVNLPGMAARITYLEDMLAQSRRQLIFKASPRKEKPKGEKRRSRRCARIPGKRVAVVCTMSELGSSSSEDNLVARQERDKAESSNSGGWGFAQFSKILPFKRPTQGASSSTALQDSLKQALAKLDAGTLVAAQDIDAIIFRACEVAAEYQEAWAARENKLMGEAAALKEKSDKLELERRQLVKKLEFVIEESMANTSELRKKISDTEAQLQQAEQSKAAQERQAHRLSTELSAALDQLQKEKGAVLEMKGKLAEVASLQPVAPGLRDTLAQATRERDAATETLASALALLVAYSGELAEAKEQLVNMPGLASRIAYLEDMLAQSRRLLNVKVPGKILPSAQSATSPSSAVSPLQAEVAARVAAARMLQQTQQPTQPQPQPQSLQKMMQQLQQQQQQQAEVQKQLELSRQQQEEMLRRLELSQQQQQEVQALLEQAQKELETLQAQHVEQKGQLTRLSQVQQENERLIAARSQLEEEIRRLTAAYEAEKARADEATKPPPKENWKPFFGPREQFELKARARQLRPQYIDLGKPYSDQAPQVEQLVRVLVEEFDAPEDWTRRYVETSLRTLFEIPSLRFGNIWEKLEE